MPYESEENTVTVQEISEILSTQQIEELTREVSQMNPTQLLDDGLLLLQYVVAKRYVGIVCEDD